jgi:phosphoribosylglycinamide formyltransferase-1
MIRIAIFASGNGTNAESIIKYFSDSTIARVVLVLSNNKNAKVLERANKLKISTVCFDKEDLYSSKSVEVLLKDQADFIVLAGFLCKIPVSIIQLYPDKILNIHPALLPKYGGKGMYGDRVHKAVKQAKEKESGISIHFVNEDYDKGRIVFQKSFEITSDMSVEDIAKKIHELEHLHFPKVIEEVVKNN